MENHPGGLTVDIGGGFNGLIDQVRVYSKALISAQIKKIYAEGLLSGEFNLN